MLEEFKKFALKGNVVDLAIGEEDLSLTRTVRVSRNGCTVPNLPRRFRL